MRRKRNFRFRICLSAYFVDAHRWKRGGVSAPIANLINEAAIAATRRNAEDVAFNDFTTAMERVVAGNLGTMEASCVM